MEYKISHLTQANLLLAMKNTDATWLVLPKHCLINMTDFTASYALQAWMQSDWSVTKTDQLISLLTTHLQICHCYSATDSGNDSRVPPSVTQYKRWDRGAGETSQPTHPLRNTKTGWYYWYSTVSINTAVPKQQLDRKTLVESGGCCSLLLI